MVEIYKTSVTKKGQARLVSKMLKQKLPQHEINFDLEDCDNILRVENPNGEIDNDVILQVVTGQGILIEVLADGREAGATLHVSSTI